MSDILNLECSQLSGLTRRKTIELLKNHKALVGFIVMDVKTGSRTYIDAGAVRKLSMKDSYDFIQISMWMSQWANFGLYRCMYLAWWQNQVYIH